MDPFDLVARFFRALNSRDVDGALACLSDQAVLEAAVPGEPTTETVTGRAAARRYLEEIFASQLPGEPLFAVRTIGGIGTGWGWVRAVWDSAGVDAAGRHAFAGDSHFLVEDGLIRRMRSHSRAIDPDRLPGDEGPRMPRDYPARPLVGVGAVVLADARACERAGAEAVTFRLGVVLVKRRYEPLAGQWSLPGGMLETGETLEAGTAREIEEETGLAIDVGPVVEVFDRIMFDTDGRVRHHYVLVDYLCAIRSGRLRPASDVSDCVLADAADLGPYRVAPKVEVVVKRALGMRAAGL